MNVAYSLLRDLPDFYKIPTTPGSFGRFAGRVLDKPRPGSKYGRALTPWQAYNNGSTYLGLNYLLNTSFKGTTPSSSWFCFLIADGGYSALSANDTSASHVGWVELTTYTSATRPAWSPSAAASGVITIAPTAITYTTSSDSLIRGAGLANSSTKSSAVDLIYSTAVQPAAQSILSGQMYQLIYFAGITPSA